MYDPAVSGWGITTEYFILLIKMQGIKPLRSLGFARDQFD
jgi:hypothetical protein